MARLQDFPSVTPTSSDKLLVVQSQGQGLVPYGSKLDSANPTGTGSLSMNRASGSTVGTNSATVGNGNTASGESSFAEGRLTTASGTRSHAEGSATTASGSCSHAENAGTISSGDYSHAEGYVTIANHLGQHVFGVANIADASTAAATSKGNYIEIVGNGSNNANRSNARTLDWSGNEVLAGGLKINSTETITALKSSSVTMSSTATSGQYASDLDWSSYRIVNAWITARACQIIVRPSLQNKVIFNIYEMQQVGGIYAFQPITDSSITVNFFYF